MSETMIERIAKAIGDAIDPTSGDPIRVTFHHSEFVEGETMQEQLEQVKSICLAAARAAIEAMREEDLRIELAKRKFDELYTINDDGCFVWHGTIDRRDGYGRFYDASNRMTQTAYGFAWRYHCGEVPDGMVLDHVCRNRACVNHTHLRVVTNAENVLSGAGITAENASKRECIHGHPLDGENLYVRPNGERDCRCCRTEAVRRYKAKKRAALSTNSNSLPSEDR